MRQILWVLAIGLTLGGVAEAKLYKWVDKDGKVHYSDRVPPEAAALERKELSKQGVTVKTTERAKTPEEKAAEEAKIKQEAEAAKAAKQKEDMDKLLLQSYLSEEDLKRSHTNELKAVDVVVNTTNISLKSQEASLAQHLALAADKKAQKQPVPKTTLDAIAKLQTTINTQRATLARKAAERVALQKSFQAKLQRYRELKAKAAAPKK